MFLKITVSLSLTVCLPPAEVISQDFCGRIKNRSSIERGRIKKLVVIKELWPVEDKGAGKKTDDVRNELAEVI